jgi:hypothetical protein
MQSERLSRFISSWIEFEVAGEDHSLMAFKAPNANGFRWPATPGAIDDFLQAETWQAIPLIIAA